MKTRKEVLALGNHFMLNPTSAEAVALANLKANGYVEGKDFFFQKNFGFFVLDFIFPEKMLVIELDGVEHYESARMRQDIIRTRFCTNLGLKVVRMVNDRAEYISDTASEIPSIADNYDKYWKAVKTAAAKQRTREAELGLPRTFKGRSRPDVGAYYSKILYRDKSKSSSKTNIPNEDGTFSIFTI